MSSQGDLTLKEAAQYFGVSEQTVRRWIKSGKITAELRDSPYGPQYYVPGYQIQAAAEIQDVVKVDRTVDMASLAKVMEHYLTEREQALLETMEGIQSEIRESIQRFEHRESELVNEIAAAREENKALRELVEDRLEERDRKLMETLRALQQKADQEKRKKSWWPWNK